MVLGQPVGYIKLRSSLAKPWRRLWGELPYLGPQDKLPSKPKWARPTIPPRWDDRQCYTHSYADRYRYNNSYGYCNGDSFAEGNTNAQAASDAGSSSVASCANWNALRRRIRERNSRVPPPAVDRLAAAGDLIHSSKALATTRSTSMLDALRTAPTIALTFVGVRVLAFLCP